MGLIFQQQKLLNDRSILANVMLPLLVVGAHKTAAEQRARAALDKAGLLTAPWRVRCRCRREQQRVSIARAIVNRPQIILAGRTDGQPGPRQRQQGARRPESLPPVGVTCLISSHDEQMPLTPPPA